MELGPRELLPGTHMKPSQAAADEEGLLCAGPAGTLAIHHQSIVHRRAQQMDAAEGVYRHMLKYSYWRNEPPTRDWTISQALTREHATTEDTTLHGMLRTPLRG